MPQLAQAIPIDERLVRCAVHNTCFYAAFPRTWSLSQLLQALARHFASCGHRHVPWETIDLVPVRSAHKPGAASPAGRRTEVR